MAPTDAEILTPTEPLLPTDRGDLWLARRGKSRRLIRLIESRLADRQFQEDLHKLQSALASYPTPLVLRIVDDGFHGDHYYIEYDLMWQAKSLTQYLRQARWLESLRLLRGMTAAYENWRRLPLPVGLHAGSLVPCRIGHQWAVHLAPCPQIVAASPYDLIRTDPAVLAAVAPERIRCKSFSGLMEDVYSAGALALQAFGIRAFGPADPEERVEAQARGALNPVDLELSTIDRRVASISSVKDSLAHLRAVIVRCMAFSPEARPSDLGELQTALDRVLVLEDPATLCGELDSRQRPGEALQYLDWAFECGVVPEVDQNRIRMLAANLAGRLQMPMRELHYLEPIKGEAARRRRLEIRYTQYVNRTSARSDGADPEGDQLLSELEHFRPIGTDSLDSDERRQVKEDRLRAAMIYLRRGDLHRRAGELYALTQLDFKDIDALFLYGLSLNDLRVPPDTMNQLAKLAAYRLEKLEQAGVLDREEVISWNERFQSLRR
jgi:hypothetical protein